MVNSREDASVQNDAALLQRAMEYDRDALAHIYDLYHPKIYAYIYSRIGDRQIAEDLTGEVFMRILEALRSKRGWKASVAAWLYGIAHHLVADYYRARRKVSQPLEETTLAGDESTAVSVEEKMLKEQMRQAISELTEDQQQVLTLKFLEGLSNQEVAHILGKSEGAVKALQYRALASLARMVKPQ